MPAASSTSTGTVQFFQSVGLPGELAMGWRSKSVGSFDSEYGYSTMGYEIAGAWGARIARPHGDVISWVGDGSYLMMNSDIYSTVMTGQKVIFIVCDNGWKYLSTGAYTDDLDEAEAKAETIIYF